MLYGNATNTVNTVFQFDKIYDTRYAMDSALMSDSIAPGRHVLISYFYDKDLNSNYPVSLEDSYLSAYHELYDQVTPNRIGVSGKMYVDASCQQPYYYIQYNEVAHPDATNLPNYYIKRYGFYFKAYQFVPSETYYTSSSEELAAYGVTTGQIVRRRYNNSQDNGDTIINPLPNRYTNEFYVCTGKDGFSSYATFEPIDVGAVDLDSEDFEATTASYLYHFNIDKIHYADLDGNWGSLHKGYDGTVWQKVVGEGQPRYILIAHLNAISPSLDIVAEPPVPEGALAPFMGAESTEDLYRLHITSPWSIGLKNYREVLDPQDTEKTICISATPPGGDASTYTDTDGKLYYIVKSDEELTRYRYARNTATGKSTLTEVDTSPTSIYYNKDGFNPEKHSFDNLATNYITFTPTGKSDNYDEAYKDSVFYGKDNCPNADIQELDISLPAIGNMVSTGYDMIYGDGQEVGNTKHLRHRDIAWYQADEGDLIQQGDNHIGGKTYDLNTLAGCLNTVHNRIGQIVKDIATLPSQENIASSWLEDYIYHTLDTDKYYIKATKAVGSDIQYLYHKCTGDMEVTEYTYQADVFYKVTNGTSPNPVINPVITVIDADTNEQINLIGDDAGEFTSGATYYYREIKDVELTTFVETSVIEYEPHKYYYRSGSDFVRLNDSSPAQARGLATYTITKTGPETFEYDFNDGNLKIYVLDNYINYKLKEETVPVAGQTYFLLTPEEMAPCQTGNIPGGWVYQPNVYYYFNEDQTLAYLSTAANPDPNKSYYYFEFSKTPITIVSDQGEISYGYTIANRTPVRFNQLNNNKVFYYKTPSENYQQVTVEWLQAQPFDFFRNPRVYYTILPNDITDDIYHPGRYYVFNITPQLDGSGQIQKDQHGEIIETANSLATQGRLIKANSNNFIPQNLYFSIDSITAAAGEFYESGVYYYKPENAASTAIPSLDYSEHKQNTGSYYIKAPIYVAQNISGRYQMPEGSEWNPSATAVPWVLTLNIRGKTYGAEEIECNNGDDSINGLILKIKKKTSFGDILTRDLTTVQGAINTLNDKIFLLGSNYTPNRILYTDLFGRVASSTVAPNTLYEAIEYKHNHSNKSVLDGITSTKISNWDTASTNSHTHSNKSVLDGITSTKVSNWDTASTNSHTHSNKSVLDGITSTQISNWDNASSGNHSHSNKSVLDGITSTKVSNWDSAVTNSHIHVNSAELALIQSGDVAKWNAKQDAIAANTYDTYGSASSAEQNAKNYADGLASNYDASGAAAGVQSTITGTNEDTKTDLTLYGLLAYIDELEGRIAALES